MADEQNTVPINDELPSVEPEQVVANVSEAPVVPEEVTAPQPQVAEPAVAPEAPVAPQDTSGFDNPQTPFYEVQPAPASPVAATDPTIAVDAVPAAPVVQETIPMPNPYPVPQPTTPIAPAMSYEQSAPKAAEVPPAPTYQYAPQVPPAPTYPGASVPAGGSYANAVSTPVYTPEQVFGEVNQLTGGMKFGWLLVGMFLGIVGMILAWLTNADKHPQVKKDAIMWSVIGFAIAAVFAIIASVAAAGLVAAAISAAGGYY